MLDLIVLSVVWFWVVLICCVKLFCCVWFKLDVLCNVFNVGCLFNVKFWCVVFNWFLVWFVLVILLLIFWIVGLLFNIWLILVNFWCVVCNFWLYVFNEVVVIFVVFVGWLIFCFNCVFVVWSGVLFGVNVWCVWFKLDLVWFVVDVFVLIWFIVGEFVNIWLICWILLCVVVNFVL